MVIIILSCPAKELKPSIVSPYCLFWKYYSVLLYLCFSLAFQVVSASCVRWLFLFEYFTRLALVEYILNIQNSIDYLEEQCCILGWCKISFFTQEKHRQANQSPQNPASFDRWLNRIQGKNWGVFNKLRIQVAISKIVDQNRPWFGYPSDC